MQRGKFKRKVVFGVCKVCRKGYKTTRIVTGICKKCRIKLTMNKYYARHIKEKRKYGRSLECKRYKRAWYKKNIKRCRAYSRKWQRKYSFKKKKFNFLLKKNTFIHYSGNPPKCQCCGEKHIEFLTIDHIKGGGAVHRRKIKRGTGTNFYHWLKKNNYPKGFRVLCINCNFSLGHFGYCPHNKSNMRKKLYKSEPAFRLEK